MKYTADQHPRTAEALDRKAHDKSVPAERRLEAWFHAGRFRALAKLAEKQERAKT